MGKKVKKPTAEAFSVEGLGELKTASQQVLQALEQLDPKAYPSAALSQQLKQLEQATSELKKTAKDALHSLKKEIKKHQKILLELQTKPSKKPKAAAKKAPKV